jgi:hypothetical protein
MAGAGILTILATFIVGVWELMAAGRKRRAEAQAAKQAERTRRADERAARAQLQQWREMVERQMSRGHAGNASAEEAAAALRGRGGRVSPLDDRWI